VVVATEAGAGAFAADEVGAASEAEGVEEDLAAEAASVEAETTLMGEVVEAVLEADTGDAAAELATKAAVDSVIMARTGSEVLRQMDHPMDHPMDQDLEDSADLLVAAMAEVGLVGMDRPVEDLAAAEEEEAIAVTSSVKVDQACTTTGMPNVPDTRSLIDTILLAAVIAASRTRLQGDYLLCMCFIFAM